MKTPKIGDLVKLTIAADISETGVSQQIVTKINYTTLKYFFFDYNGSKLMRSFDIITKIYTKEEFPEMYL